MSSNEQQPNADPSLTRSLDLFSFSDPALPEELENGLARCARIAAELLRCKDAWLELPGVGGGRFPPKISRKGGLGPVDFVIPILFPAGLPTSLAIFSDIAITGAGAVPRSAIARFVVAAPIIGENGSPVGVLILTDSKPRELTDRQVDALTDIAALAARAIERDAGAELTSSASIRVSLPVRRSEEALLDDCQSPAWLIDGVSNRVVVVNHAALDLFGYTRDEFLKFSNSDHFSETSQPISSSSDAAAPILYTVHNARDSRISEIEIISATAEFGGRPGRLHVARDITRWVRLEEKSTFQSGVLAQINDAVIAVDLNFRITYWNHIAEQLYDWRAAEVLGERLPDVLQPIWRDEQQERDASTNLLAEGRWSGETVHHRRSGESIFIESTATAVIGPDNQTIGFFCLNRDITDRKKMESSLQESEQRYRSLFDFHPDAVVWIDPDGKFLSANLACREILGYRPDELIGKPFLSLIDPRDRVLALNIFERAIHGEPISYEYTGVHKEGRKVSLAAVALPVIVEGQIVGVYAIAKDIGERKRMQGVIAAENEVLQWLAANKPLHAVIDRLIVSIEERYEWLRCTVTVLADDRRREVVTAPGVSERARDYLVQHASVPMKSTVARAIETRQRTLSTDIATDPAAEDQREFATLLGAAAASTTPITGTSGDVLGTFTLFLPESRSPSPEELNIADRAATLLRIAIETDRAHLRLLLTERAMNSTVASVMIVDPNKHERPIIYVNQAFERMTGYREEDVVGRSTSILHGKETDRGQLEEIERAVAEQRECNVLLKYYSADGAPYWSSSSISPVRDASGRLTHFIEVQNDVTRLMTALDAVRESEQRFRQLIENASDMVLVLEETGEIRYVSPAVERIMGYTPDEVRKRDVFEFFHPEDLVKTRSLFIRMMEGLEDVYTVELRTQRKDGSWCHVEATIQNLLGKPGVRGIVVNARDLSERKQAKDRLDHLAYHDLLTDLPNRLLFNDHLMRDIANARRRSCMVAVLFLDLDRFKVINDTLGHSVGDELLQNVAQRLTTAARDGDTVARWGGDEFTIILASVTNSRDAARAAQRIINSLSEPFYVSGHELYITATVGISMFPVAGEDVETLVRNADTAMYRAKDEGQNHYQFYTPKMNAGAGQRLALESRLRRALEREEFTLYYQPQIDSKTGKIVSAEALVRWQHPELGLVPPKEFIPLAEETGLIVPIGDWIMRAACRQAKAWKDAGVEKLRIAVNLSARQFSQRDLQQMVTRTLRETGADPTWLELELTESLLINCENRVVSAMKDLTDLGVSVSIDDFGVGYSSYSYLKRYPVKALKIEQSFVQGMLSDPHDAAIVQSIISMAHKLGLHVIAEGVENKEQSDSLAANKCDLLQGYFYGRPMPAGSLTEKLAKQYAAAAAQ